MNRLAFIHGQKIVETTVRISSKETIKIKIKLGND